MADTAENPPGDGGDNADGEGAAAAPEVPKLEIPQVLKLPIFFNNKLLSDCLIKVPLKPGETDEAGDGEKKEGEERTREKEKGGAGGGCDLAGWRRGRKAEVTIARRGSIHIFRGQSDTPHAGRAHNRCTHVCASQAD